MKSNPIILKRLQQLCAEGHLQEKVENNKYLKVSYKGSDGLISSKWNVKIYTSGSIVCNDFSTLKKLLADKFSAPDTQLKLIQIDDAGIGFPLGGVMVGVTDGVNIWTDTVDVLYFQGQKYDLKQYLQEYALKGIGIIKKQGITPHGHRIEICTGFINTVLRDALRNRGFDVRVTEIRGLLQDRLEEEFKNYVREITDGQDIAYDPKLISKASIAQKYYAIVSWGKKNKPHLLKTGWNSLRTLST